MVEVKNNKTAEELFQGIKSIIEEVHKTYPTSIEGYIECGEYDLGKIKSYDEELYNLINKLGNFGKLILGYIKCACNGKFDYYYADGEAQLSEEKARLFGKKTINTMCKVPMKQGELNFELIADDLYKLPNIDTGILKVLGTRETLCEISHIILEEFHRAFGNDLGMKILGLISFFSYQKIIDNLESKTGENCDYKAFRAMVHKFPRPESFDKKAVEIYRYCDDTPTEEEKKFINLTMAILECKAIAMYEKITSKPFLPMENEGNGFNRYHILDIIKKVDFSDIIYVPYIGYFDALTSDFAKKVLDEKIKNLNEDYRFFISNAYEAFKKFISESKETQITKEKALIEEVAVIIKKAFDNCKSIEEKLALARAYALDKKSELVPNGQALLQILGIKGKKPKQLSDEEKLLQYYILSIYYARPVLEHIVEYKDGTSIISEFNYNGDMRYSCTSTMYDAMENRKKFETLANKMGVVLNKPTETKVLKIKSDRRWPVVEPILIAKYIENDGGVICRALVGEQYQTITPAAVLKECSYANFIGSPQKCRRDSDNDMEDWDLTHGV